MHAERASEGRDGSSAPVAPAPKAPCSSRTRRVVRSNETPALHDEVVGLVQHKQGGLRPARGGRTSGLRAERPPSTGATAVRRESSEMPGGCMRLSAKDNTLSVFRCDIATDAEGLGSQTDITFGVGSAPRGLTPRATISGAPSSISRQARRPRAGRGPTRARRGPWRPSPHAMSSSRWTPGRRAGRCTCRPNRRGAARGPCCTRTGPEGPRGR